MGKTKKGKGTKWMVVVSGEGTPVALHLDAATPAEVNLLEQTLDNVRVQPAADGEPAPKPERVVCDKGYDSDGLRERLLFERDIELVCPHRKGRKRPALQDGRKLRRYKRRWKVERTFAWLGNFRRLVVRYERRAENYLGFVHLGYIVILLRCL